MASHNFVPMGRCLPVVTFAFFLGMTLCVSEAHAHRNVGSGSSSIPCNSYYEASIAYNYTTKTVEFCNATSWGNLVSSGMTSGVYIGTSVLVANPQVTGDTTSGLFSAAARTVSIATGGVEEVTVNSAGVGIGSSLPRAVFDLSASTGAMILPIGTTEPSSPVNGMLRYSTTYNDLEAYINNVWTTMTTGGANAGIDLGTSASVTNPSRPGDLTTGLFSAVTSTVSVATGGVEALRVNASQNVGIGTTTINNRLDVYGSAGFGTYGGTAAPANGLIVSGSVGIGTNAPTSLLHVNGAELLGVATHTTGTLALAGSTSGTVTIQPANAAGTWAMTLPTTAGTNNFVLQTNGAGVTSWVSQGSGATITLGTSTSVTNPQRSGDVTTGLFSPATATVAIAAGGTEEMRVNATGVGIGTSTIANKLDVYGAAAFGTYGGTAAPTNGLIVSGNVGIGTTAAPDGLDIATNASTTSIPLNITGSWYTSGSGKPQVLIQPSSATSPTWNANGVGLGINAPSGYTGDFIDLALNGTNMLQITYQGVVNLGGVESLNGDALILTGGPLVANTSSYQDFTFAGYFSQAPTTAGTSQFVVFGYPGGETSFDPASGSETLNNVQVIGMVINQTGSATGVTRGLYLSPTVTSAYDYRAFEITAYTDNVLSGTPTTRQEMLLNAPTLQAASTTTVTNAATEIITGAPVASTNITITNPYALWVQGGVARFDGNVGVATTTPQATLDVGGYMRLSKYAAQPAACSATNDGAVALTAVYTLCICNGGSTSWVQSKDGTTACTW